MSIKLLGSDHWMMDGYVDASGLPVPPPAMTKAQEELVAARREIRELRQQLHRIQDDRQRWQFLAQNEVRRIASYIESGTWPDSLVSDTPVVARFRTLLAEQIRTQCPIPALERQCHRHEDCQVSVELSTACAAAESASTKCLSFYNVDCRHAPAREPSTEEAEALLETLRATMGGPRWTLPLGLNHIIHSPDGHLCVVHATFLKDIAKELQALTRCPEPKPMEEPHDP